MELKPIHLHHHVVHFSRMIFWFLIGGVLGLTFFVSFLLIFYQHVYYQKVYPGVMINGINFEGQTENQVRDYFLEQNAKIINNKLAFIYKDQIATSSASQLQLGYNANLLAQQAISIGRSGDIFSNASLLWQAYTSNVSLPPTYQYDQLSLTNLLNPLEKSINEKPINASFTISNSHVTAFQLAQDGQQVDDAQVYQNLLLIIPQMLRHPEDKYVKFTLPVIILKPQVTDQSMQSYGITQLIATGTSVFAGSIPSRVYNIGLAASRLDGTLVPPGQIFSFNNAVGNISSLTGYKQAYVISNGHTVLGDGGGVCQVSTTMFRAILNAGLPVIERHAHDYEVEYYTEDAPLGLDAAIYQPTDDLKFKNDTGHYILIHSIFQPDQNRLTFEFYGTSDGRQVSITQPVITDVRPAPAPLYQDDPNLPAGTLQQTDFAAPGAHVSFTRTVIRNGKTLYFDTFNSNYQPWQAVYLRGTKT